MKAFLRRHWIPILIGVLLVMLLFAVRGFIFSFEESYFEGALHKPEVPAQAQRKAAVAVVPDQKAIAMQQPSVQSIQPWMTFDYVNVVYKLPASYMKDILGVNDARYPNIRIDAYAKQSSIDTALLVSTVRTYVSQYQKMQ